MLKKGEKEGKKHQKTNHTLNLAITNKKLSYRQ